MKHILYVGFPGFPIGLAQIKRQLLIAKGLTEAGCSVRVFNRCGTHNQKEHPQIFVKGIFEGIRYEYCSGTPYRPNGFIKKNLLKIYGLLNEFGSIASCRMNHKADTMIISVNTLWGLFYYTSLAKLLRIESVFDAVEYWSVKKRGLSKLSQRLKNRLYIDLADRIIVISDFLYNRVRRINPSKPLLKVPPLCDFSRFIQNTQPKVQGETPQQQYGFLYCGSLAYCEIIHFIIEAYRKLNTDVGLVIIASGDHFAELTELRQEISQDSSNHITLLSNITDDELIGLYKNSRALLIPMRPTIQDVARFPHKIGEYTAAAKPIVSTKFGEIKHYFNDGTNAFIADNYEVDSFSRKMREILEKPSLAQKIGFQGFQTGLRHFDYQKNGFMIYDFLFNSKSSIKHKA